MNAAKDRKTTEHARLPRGYPERHALLNSLRYTEDMSIKVSPIDDAPHHIFCQKAWCKQIRGDKSLCERISRNS